MRVALGVTGGVAAYKAAELVRCLQQERLDVEVVMTRSAQQFITPLTFAALTGRKVITDMFAPETGGPANVESAIEHIAVAQRIDLLLVAPATANVLAQMANGIAEDFLTTLYLATPAPTIVAPAMNIKMWEHPATQENVSRLLARGVRIVSPEEGYLACGMTGAGRLAGNDAILAVVSDVLGLRHDLEGETVLLSAGPTCEDIDPVRYLTNRSSGKMGYALASAAQRRGARVILVSGPVSLDPPPGIDFVPVRSADEMRNALRERMTDATILIMAAAVADYRPLARHTEKMRRGDSAMALDLEPTPDILAELSREKAGRTFVGFAAETGDVRASALDKLARKGADLIVANDVTVEGAGFDTETNVVTLFSSDGRELPLAKMSKLEVADRIFNEVLRLRRATR